LVSFSRRVRGISVVLAALGMIFMAAQPVGASSTHFGAVLSTTTQPSNSPTNCDHQLNGNDGTDKCTWIEANAYNSGGSGVPGAQAPKNGTINKIKLISCHSGSFTLFIAHFNQTTHVGSVVTKGPKISYTGQCGNTTYTIQKYTISPITVHTGDYLAISAVSVGFVRCDSGGLRTALYKPPLAVGGGSATETDDSGCYLLLQAVYSS
jgi:hypothetical protein